MIENFTYRYYRKISRLFIILFSFLVLITGCDEEAPIKPDINKLQSSIELPGVIKIDFPKPISIKNINITKTTDPYINECFGRDANYLGQINRLSYEININVGTLIPAVSKFDVNIIIPDSLNFPVDHKMTLFAKIDGEYENEFEVFWSEYIAGTKVVKAPLPINLFAKKDDGTFETILIISFLPNELFVESDILTSSQSIFAPPLINLTVISPFTNPIARPCTKSIHYGVDFKALSPENVYSLENGVVSEIGNYPQKTKKNYGHLISIRHQVGNLIYFSRYAHLSQIYVSDKAEVTKGFTILGKSGNSGGVEHHLHVEYIKPLVNLSPETNLNRTEPKGDFLRMLADTLILPYNRILEVGKEKDYTVSIIDLHNNEITSQKEDNCGGWGWEFIFTTSDNQIVSLTNTTDNPTNRGIGKLKLKGVSEGTANIICNIYLKGTKANTEFKFIMAKNLVFSIEVKKRDVDKILIEPENGILKKYKELILTATAYDDSDKVIEIPPEDWVWSMNNQNIVDLMHTGNEATITGKNIGSVIITAKDSKSGKEGTSTISVIESLARIEIEPPQASVVRNKTINLNARGYDDQNKLLPIPPSNWDWTWDNNYVSVVENGEEAIVTGENLGTTTITVKDITSQTAAGSSEINIVHEIDRVEIFPGIINVVKGDTTHAIVKAFDRNNNEVFVSAGRWNWNLSSQIATLEPQGVYHNKVKITGLTAGEATLTASDSESGKDTTAELNVNLEIWPLAVGNWWSWDRMSAQGEDWGKYEIKIVGRNGVTFSTQWRQFTPGIGWSDWVGGLLIERTNDGVKPGYFMPHTFKYPAAIGDTTGYDYRATDCGVFERYTKVTGIGATYKYRFYYPNCQTYPPPPIFLGFDYEDFVLQPGLGMTSRKVYTIIQPGGNPTHNNTWTLTNHYVQ